MFLRDQQLVNSQRQCYADNDSFYSVHDHLVSIWIVGYFSENFDIPLSRSLVTWVIVCWCLWSSPGSTGQKLDSGIWTHCRRRWSGHHIFVIMLYTCSGELPLPGLATTVLTSWPQSLNPPSCQCVYYWKFKISKVRYYKLASSSKVFFSLQEKKVGDTSTIFGSWAV